MMKIQLSICCLIFSFLSSCPTTTAQDPIRMGDRRELFVDQYLIDSLNNCQIQFHHPVPADTDLDDGSQYYQTILKDGDLYRLYYRSVIPGYDGERNDGHPGEITCYAQSTDGIHWTLPDLDLYDINGSKNNNVILAHNSPCSHNFTPFIDDNPQAPPDQRYKALAGLHKRAIPDQPNPGLVAFVSADGIHWRKLRDSPVITSEVFAFDSQNVAFWSPSEQCYLCYYRTWETPHGRLRTFSRTTSPDFINWSEPVPIHPNLPDEHLYTSNVHPYFRAPHIYIALPTRFMKDRGSSTDILFMSSRDGVLFDRPFKEGYIWPGLDPARWGNRANYAAWRIVPTGTDEMSIYVKNRRFTLRTDGFASIHAGFLTGEMITKPFTFTGKTLSINYAASAAGSIQIEIQDASGAPITGYTLNDCPPIIGDAIDHAVNWNAGPDLGTLIDQNVRLRFVMKEADLYSIRFGP